VFVKTGTSRNFRDNWAMWYTDNYIIWVWVGNKDASNMKWVSGASWAWEVFRNIVYYLEPDDVEQKPKEENKEVLEKYLEITSPLQNSIYTIDKQKPLNSQSIKIEFSTNYDYDKIFYIVDDEILKNEFWNIKLWFHKIQVKLMKNWSIIETKETNIKVE
jgi:penicillin-binding protein 1C